jgi:hypothetical protein
MVFQYLRYDKGFGAGFFIQENPDGERRKSNDRYETVQVGIG